MIKPIVRWAGSKRSLALEIAKRLPPKTSNYYEPFFGGGSVFFHLCNENIKFDKYILSDINYKLMTVYETLLNFEKLNSALKFLQWGCKGDFKKFYLKIRDDFNNANKLTMSSELSEALQSARFLVLNHGGFNGLYRENLKGEFNVGCGKDKFPLSEDFYSNLKNVANAFKELEIEFTNGDFEEVLSDKKPQQDDFVYLDPPYLKSYVKNNKNYFGEDDQRRLAEVFKKLDKKGINVMVSNSYDSFFEELYEGFNIEKVISRRCINPKGEFKANELLIMNY